MKNYITIKKQAYYSALLLVISFAFHFIVQAQQPLICPEPKISKEKLARIRAYHKNLSTTKSLSANGGNIQIRVFAHIVANSDGTNAGATPEQILTEIQTMQNDFAPADICFVYVGFNQINNTLLNNINVETHDDEEDLFEPHLIPKCLNIFYTHQIRGTNDASGGGFGGITFDLPNTWCLVANGSLGAHTSSHETGHCFGLLHTFDYQRNGLENINGDDCDDLGDLICDTHADPYAYRGNPICYSESGGFYTGLCTDPNGQSNFSPPYNNIMSYWHHTPESFSLDQRQFMDVTIANESELSELTSTDNILFAGINHVFEIDFQTAKNSITTVGTNKLLQVSQTGLIAQKVIVGAGFHAKPGSGGYTILKANECSGVSSKTAIAQVESVQTKTITKAVQPELKIYPNPSSGNFIVEFKSEEFKTGSATMICTNAMGKTLWSRKINVLNGKIKEQVISNAAITNGIYLITLIVDGKRFNKQIVIAK